MPPLGRWKLDYCSNQINRKIDMANEDHCCPCGQNLTQETEPNTRNQT